MRTRERRAIYASATLPAFQATFFVVSPGSARPRVRAAALESRLRYARNFVARLHL